MPRAIAMELLLSGREMDADEAARWGVVNLVTEPDGLLDAARELAERIATAAPLATRAVKAIVAATEGRSVEDGYRALNDGSIAAYDRVLASEDAREGPRAFADGRDPEWKGR